MVPGAKLCVMDSLTEITFEDTYSIQNLAELFILGVGTDKSGSLTFGDRQNPQSLNHKGVYSPSCPYEVARLRGIQNCVEWMYLGVETDYGPKI